MDNIAKQLLKAKHIYDNGGHPLNEIKGISSYCIAKLAKEASIRSQAPIDAKKYYVFYQKSAISRPFLPTLMLSDKAFSVGWDKLISALNPTKNCVELDPEFINQVLYSAITPFCVCFDLWKNSSRKTPGTYFEVLLGSIVGKILPNHDRTKFIPLKEFQEKVSTDIVFTNKKSANGLIIPAKITTRERMVQPFAHQRILESVFGHGKFSSILVCVSELQRAGEDDVNEICVPGTIKLFQCHLAKLRGIYYLDPPRRYLSKDVLDVINVSSLGQLLSKDLPNLIS